MIKTYKKGGEKYEILQYLREKKDYVFAGVIEDFFRTKYGEAHKGSTTNRRLQELFNDGRIEREFLDTLTGKSKAYRYSFAREEEIRNALKQEQDNKIMQSIGLYKSYPQGI